MTVYVLYVSYNFEAPDVLEGIYSTREKAESAQKQVSNRNYAWIEEEEVQ